MVHSEEVPSGHGWDDKQLAEVVDHDSPQKLLVADIVDIVLSSSMQRRIIR